MRKARIYQPTKSAMQSAHMKKTKWAFEFEAPPESFIEPLMGWTSSRQTISQVKLYFSTLEEALAYAKRYGIEAEVKTPLASKFIKKSYSDNFRYS